MPALRRELAKCFLDSGLKQKKAAELLRVTEPAVSQYLKSKRAQDIVFTNEIKAEIKKSADRISQNNECVVKEIQNLCNFIKKTNFLCKIHKKYSEVCALCKSI